MKSTITNSQPKTKKTSNKRALILIVLLLIAGGAGFLFYQKHQNNQAAEAAFQADKAKFAQVEKDMAVAYERMTRDNKAEAENRYEECSETSLKLEAGQLSCEVSYRYVYGFDSYDQAAERMTSLISNLKEITSFKVYDDATPLLKDRASELYDSKRGTGIDLEHKSGVRCKLEFDTQNPATNPEYSSLTSSIAAVYFYRCYEDMNQPIYTLAE